MFKKFVLILFLFLLCSKNSSANIINVPSDQTTIQAGIDSAVNGDTVLVDIGTYSESINFNGKNIVLTSHFILNNDTSKILETIINGNYSVVTFNSNEDSSAKLIGFTIQNGFATNGGGIYCNDSDPILLNLIIKNNIGTSAGGGIYADHSEFTLKNSIIKNNRAGSWWGGDGGGMTLAYSNVYIENVQISDNESRYGITPDYGGGIFCYASNLYLKNVLINNNKGRGGIASMESNVNIINSTFNDNNTYGIHTESSNVNIINSIFWNNQSDEIRNYVSDTTLIVITHSDIQDSINGIAINDTRRLIWLDNNISIEPEFVNPTSNNYNLLPSSPCIDAGVQDTFFVYNNNNDTIYVPEINYLGFAPDIGAFEFNPATNLSNDEDMIPSSIKLFQNYPNPFNSATTIEYYLPQSVFVNIVIFNLLGQKVKTLMNSDMLSGLHEIKIDANDLSSGVYLYRIDAGEYQQVRKMILLK